MIVFFAAARVVVTQRSGRENCVAPARATANETRKMISRPQIYECLLQGTMRSHLNYIESFLGATFFLHFFSGLHRKQ